VASLIHSRALTPLALTFALALSACQNTSIASANDVTTLDWQGTYQGPYHLFLTIKTDGNKANGIWRAVGNRQGEFTGTIAGDRLDIDWREAGGGSAWSGRGYFLFHSAHGKHPAQIFGERGMGRSETGDAWWAFKSANSVTASRDLLDTARGPDTSDEDNKCPGCDEVEWER
jgi:hypothetical protein